MLDLQQTLTLTQHTLESMCMMFQANLLPLLIRLLSVSTTQTIQANGVYAGPYGYVHDFNDVTNHLKVSLSPGSPAFTAGTVFYDTPTLTNADRRRTEVVDGKILTINNIGAADGSRAAGTYANLTPSSTSGSGDLTTTRVTVVVDGSGAATITLVNGGKGHAGSDTITINDGLLGSGGGAALTFDVATISTESIRAQLVSTPQRITFSMTRRLDPR